MFWNPRKAAFRSGSVSGTQWNDGNIGLLSAAMGYNSIASGDYSFSFGNSNVASGNYTTAFGTSNTATGIGSTVFGYRSSADGEDSTVFGRNNISSSYGETVLGIGATTYTPSANGATQFRTANATDRLFAIGNAIDSNNNSVVDIAERSDAMVILKNGLTRLPSTTNTMINAADGKTLVTKEYLQSTAPGSLDQAYDFGGAGLGKTITADAGAVLINGTDGFVSTGTYGSGISPPNGGGVKMFWNPRKAAFRVGLTHSSEWDDINVGAQSIAFGEDTIASALYATAFGNDTKATAFNATAFGFYSIASGSYSTAMGDTTIASGSTSTAFGDHSKAYGINATAFGSHTTATGVTATSFGDYSRAIGTSSTAFGDHTEANGTNSVAFGTSAVANGESATAFGKDSRALGVNSTSFGVNTTASGMNSTTFGNSNNAYSYAETVLGVGATTYIPTTNGNIQFRSTNQTDRLFVIGNATDSNANDLVDPLERRDAIVILKNGLTRLPSTTSAMITAADGKAVVTKEFLISNGAGTLNQAYDFGGAGLGKTITADAGAVLIDGTDGFVSTGTLNSGAIAPSGAGTKMFWNPRKAAFRVGISLGTLWDDNNIGRFSSALGYDTTASGSSSTAFGHATAAQGNNSTAFGNFSIASGESSTALGELTFANGDNSTAFGRLTIASGLTSTAYGLENAAKSFGETVIGIGATVYTPSTNGATQFRTANATDRLFVIGNAIDSNNNSIVDAAERSDALVVLKNGNTGIGTSSPQQKLHVVGKIRMVDGTQGAGKVLTCDATGTAMWNTISATNAWGLGGNVGTSPATNFIGTSDNTDLSIRTNSATRARILATGEFGIGTVTPDRKLEVEGAGIQYARITSTGSSAVGIEFKRTGGGNDWQMRNDGGEIIFGQSADELVTVTDVVRIGGGSFTPVTDNSIQLGQSAKKWSLVYATNGVIQTSDANDKKEMLPLNYGLEKIKSLRPISFQWKNDNIDKSSTHLGFVAQEVQQVLPEIVVDHEWKEIPDSAEKVWQKSDKLGMKYAEIIPVLVKAIQEQQVQVEEQHTKLQTLALENEILKTKLEEQSNASNQILKRLEVLENRN